MPCPGHACGLRDSQGYVEASKALIPHSILLLHIFPFWLWVCLLFALIDILSPEQQWLIYLSKYFWQTLFVFVTPRAFKSGEIKVSLPGSYQTHQNGYLRISLNLFPLAPGSNTRKAGCHLQDCRQVRQGRYGKCKVRYSKEFLRGFSQKVYYDNFPHVPVEGQALNFPALVIFADITSLYYFLIIKENISFQFKQTENVNNGIAL